MLEFQIVKVFLQDTQQQSLIDKISILANPLRCLICIYFILFIKISNQLKKRITSYSNSFSKRLMDIHSRNNFSNVHSSNRQCYLCLL